MAMNLLNCLYDRKTADCELDSNVPDVKDSKFAEFISLRMDNDEFAEFASYDLVEVPDEDVDGWYEQFNLWLEEN